MQSETDTGWSLAREVVFLLAGQQNRVVGVGIGSSAVSIEDSRSLWDQIWQNREVLTEISHTHPLGPDRLSVTDVETASAIVKALGKPLTFTVVHPRGSTSCMFYPGGRWGKVCRRELPFRWWEDLMWDLSASFEPREVPERKQES